MITVCEKKTNKQTLRLLGSTGEKKKKRRPCANNKLEGNFLLFGQRQSLSTERFCSATTPHQGSYVLTSHQLWDLKTPINLSETLSG